MQNVASQDLRETALGRLAAGQHYEFLALAGRQVLRDPDDEHIRLMMVRAYLELGLVCAARDALEEVARRCAEPELDRLNESLAALAQNPIGWSQHATRFQANLATLSERFEIDPIRSAWRTGAGCYQLFSDRNGEHQVREKGKVGDGWHWFPVLDRHSRSDRTRPIPELGNMPPPILFEGIGLGGYFGRVYEATLNTFLGYSCALVIVEPRPARLAVALHLQDWQELLADPRVFVVTGEDWPNQLRLLWEADYDLPFPSQVVTIGAPAAGPRPIDTIRHMVEERAEQIRVSAENLAVRYAGRHAGYWAERFTQAVEGGGEPLRILTAVSTHTTFLQHSVRDCKRALEALGHKVLLLTERTPYAQVGPLTYHQAIHDFDPDLFLVLDHLRPEFKGLIPASLPVLSWDQDQLPHVITRSNIAGMARHDFLVACSKIRCLDLGIDPLQCWYARVPTCPEQFSGDPLTDQEQETYTCDVSYVSHASQTPTQFHDQERHGYTQRELVRLLDTIYELLPEMLARYSVADDFVTRLVLREAMARSGVCVTSEELRSRLETWYIWRLADRIFRHEALSWAAEWAAARGRDLRIYGNGWGSHPTLARFARGPVRNGRELLCVYRASQINLQLMPGGFIHQRALDGLAGGGFFLTRKTPADVKGVVLRRLNARMLHLGIENNEALLSSQDVELRRTLSLYAGPWLAYCLRLGIDLHRLVRVNSELIFPDEAFEDFHEIVFDSRELFAQLADRYLAHSVSRRAIAQRMRGVVIETFSYKAALDLFLRRMTGHLRSVPSFR